MSKIGKQPVKIPEGITILIEDDVIKVKNKSSEISVPVLKGIKVTFENDELNFSLLKNNKQTWSNWGTQRSLVANAVLGLKSDFIKTLVLEGVGFRIIKEGNGLVLNLGFSHPVRFPEVSGITFELEKNNILRVKGADKFLVGQTAAKIRALKKPEPYKGKGFRYSDEIIRRKAGKKAASSTG